MLNNVVPIFYMIIGLPASGKSTYAKELSQKYNCIIHSSDLLRQELFGNINCQENNDALFRELHNRIKNDLIKGKNVIFDACNISYKKRINFIKELKKIKCNKIAVFIATPYEKCLENNQKRDRKVPEYIIERMYKNIYIVQNYEGWDSIEIIWNTDGYNFYFNELFNGENGLNEIDQENPHHTLTIGKHCLRCSEICENLLDDFELNMAALYHDIGKGFTKAFKNYKGEDSEIAHYYQHHLVSAYDTLFYLNAFKFDTNCLLNITNYIQWHMQPFFIETEKSRNKFINLVGQEFYNKLMILHEADVQSH